MNRRVAQRSTDATDPAEPGLDVKDASEAAAAPPRLAAPDETRSGSGDRAGTDRVRADQPTPDPAGADQSGADRPGALISPDRGRAGRNRRRLRRRAALVLAWVILMLIPMFVAKIYVIPSGSMETTLHGCAGCTNDRILVDKLAYRFGAPVPGDIVVFTLPDTWTNTDLRMPHDGANPVVAALQQLGSLVGLHPADSTQYVKRVIAVGGQTVACCDERNRVVVDGVALDEPYIYFLPEAGAAQQASFGPVRVPEGHLWMMGDSRNDSIDSRAEGNGPVPMASVIGKARFIIYPLGRFGAIPAPPAG